MTDFAAWVALGANAITAAYVAGVLTQRVRGLENRMNAKSEKDDRRDSMLTEIRVDVAAIKQTLEHRSKWPIW